MRVAHTCIVTPRRCGLYETTHELVSGLRELGIDSRLIDIPGSNNLFKGGYPANEDRGVPVDNMDWALEADVIVNHSGYDGTPLEHSDQPIVHIAHGRPRHGFLTEKSGGTPIYSYHYRKNTDPRWRFVVTFWPQHVRYLKVMFPDKPIGLVQAPVNLEAWRPGPATYDFKGKGGEVNVVCADAWRDDVDPYLPLNAFALWARENAGARLHLYGNQTGLKGFSPIIRRIQDDGNMGEVSGWVKHGLDEIYRSADMVLTANEIDTRSVREAMACGCPVVRVDSSLRGYDVDFVTARVADRAQVRMQAEARFDPKVTAVQFQRILDSVS